MGTGSDLRRAAYETLRKKILSGELECGEIYSASGLARSLEMSRTPVREAFIQLERDNLVKEVPNAGYMVRPLSLRGAYNIIELLKCIECYVVDEMRQQELVPNLPELYRCIERQRERILAGNFDRAYRENCLFHRGMLAAISNDEITNLYLKYSDTIVYMGHLSDSSQKQQLAVLDEHVKILRALEARDYARAKREVKAHYRNSMQRLMI